MYCKKCGQQIDDGANFCEHCGADQRPAPEAQPAAAEWQPSNPEAQPAAAEWQPSNPGAEGGYQPAFSTLPEQGQVKGTAYLVWSILVTLFCCLPLGIPAIVFAAKIDSCNARGDYTAAAEAARKSKNFSIWGAVLSLVLGLISSFLAVMVGLEGLM